jgi:hypothetical protein
MVDIQRALVAAAVSCASAASLAGNGLLPSTFTHQGRVNDGGAPANGPHDFTCTLWDAAAAGNLVSAAIRVVDVPVTDGLFTIDPDFGAGVFDGSERFLEIEVDGIPLSPRQPITATPYALQTRGIYVDTDGNVVTDVDGLATITMPEWFEALNRDFRYQLTVIGRFAQAIVARELHEGAFVIRTDKPGVKVSWQITGIRQDAWAEANRIPVEIDKPAHARGNDQPREPCGQPPESVGTHDATHTANSHQGDLP